LAGSARTRRQSLRNFETEESLAPTSDFAIKSAGRLSQSWPTSRKDSGAGARRSSFFLRISHASALETQSHLYVASDLGYLDQQEFESLRKQVVSVSRLLGGFIHYLANHKDPSTRTKQPNTNQPNNR